MCSWGWPFDVEDVPLADRDRCIACDARAAQALHRAGRTISVAVVPRAFDAKRASMRQSCRRGFSAWALGQEDAAV